MLEKVNMNEKLSKTVPKVCPQRKRKRKNFSVVCNKACPRKKIKLAPLISNDSECCFCHEGPNEAYGLFFQDKSRSIASHQFCLFFSAGLPQMGEDHEGFDGFMVQDIYKEAQRANKIECKVCHTVGASSGCSRKSCRIQFHFKCGLKEGMQFKFSDPFDCFCNTHRSHQDLTLIKKLKPHPSCPICLETITKMDEEKVLKTPCCKNVFIHRDCIQLQANTSGYFFRCPTCNNDKLFTKEMTDYGIFVPLRDAAWEDQNAYSDLLEQYGKCDLYKCKCRRGRQYCTKSGPWNLLRCYVCGQSGVHVACLHNHYIPGIGYVCLDCNKIVKIAKTSIDIVQHGLDNRLQEHKKRLLELRSRDDPVLLASSTFGIPILLKRFNIKPCKVNVKALDVNDLLFKNRSIRVTRYPYFKSELGNMVIVKKKYKRKRGRKKKQRKGKYAKVENNLELSKNISVGPITLIETEKLSSVNQDKISEEVSMVQNVTLQETVTSVLETKIFDESLLDISMNEDSSFFRNEKNQSEVLKDITSQTNVTEEFTRLMNKSVNDLLLQGKCRSDMMSQLDVKNGILINDAC